MRSNLWYLTQRLIPEHQYDALYRQLTGEKLSFNFVTEVRDHLLKHVLSNFDDKQLRSFIEGAQEILNVPSDVIIGMLSDTFNFRELAAVILAFTIESRLDGISSFQFLRA